MKNPVTSITDDQLSEIEKEFGRNSPCRHHNREPIGFGCYHRCHDCGRDVPSEMLDNAQAASVRHDEFQVILRDAFACLRAAEADSKRWNLRAEVLRQLYNPSISNEELDSAIDAAMERKA